MKSNFFILLLLLVAVGCKDKASNQENQEQTETTEVVDNSFKVLVTAVVKKNDDFCLLYTENESLNFNEGVWKGVQGMENEQTIEFSLPKDVFPSQLRLDLGKSQDQDDIVLKAIRFKYAGNEREIRGAELGIFFRPDPSKCTFDSSTGVIKALVKDGKKEIPSLYPNEAVLAAELPKLAQ